MNERKGKIKYYIDEKLEIFSFENKKDEKKDDDKVSINTEISMESKWFKDINGISIEVGLKGVLASGKIGVKLSFDKKFVPTIDSYYELQDFVFSFYIRISIEVRLTVFTFAFHFYIYNKNIFWD